MRTTRILALALLASVSGCVENAAQESTMPEPVTVQGPPGGGQDPGYGYQQPQEYGQDPGYYQDPSQVQGDGDQAPPLDANGVAEAAPDGEGQPGDVAQDPAAAVANVDDGQIDQALEGHGHWEDIDGYGRVWVPDATEVGADFTPYETAGSWIDTDAGWAFDSDWDWGWLPFHYGRWGWFDGFWGWCPGYNWGPGWVDWRHGGGYVGWRPQAPIIRDHRTHHEYAAHDAHWRFQGENDFGHGRVHAHLYNNVADGLRVTAPVARPPLRGAAPVHASQVMRGRLTSRASVGVRSPGRTWQGAPQSGGIQRGVQQPRGAYQQPRGAYQQPRGAYQQPYRGAYQQPYRGAYQQPQRPQYQQPQRPQYQQPQRPQYQQPQRPQYQQPYRGGSYQAPTRTYSPPSRPSSSSAPSHSYSAPSHSSGSSSSYSHSSGGGSSHSSSSGSSSSSHSSGGGGHHR